MIALVASFLPVIGIIAWPLSIAGIFLSALLRSKMQRGETPHDPRALRGLLLSVIALVICAIWFFGFVVHAALNPVPANRATPPPAVQPPTASTTSAAPPPPAPDVVTVSEVIDGDTFRAHGPDGRDRLVRVLGIDAPDLGRGTPLADCVAGRARQFAVDTLAARVTLVAVPGQPDRDADGRELRYVTLADGRDYSVAVAEAGHATVSYPSSADSSKIAAISQAALRGAGPRTSLWSECAPSPPPPPAPPPPPPAPLVPPEPVPEDDSDSTSAYYANCTEARNAGASPLYAGEPGYRPGLDRDKDGVACE
ncbi:hypothetical protein GCM10009533_16290 [Saccharopolyspora spinosporotrichia]|uniref:TNase-like domain-containing protein n=1 Tax=Saccharopolyspora erythraea TaxID=1836 RepID=A0ABN1CGV6_SACER